jgi:hypothetical protein
MENLWKCPNCGTILQKGRQEAEDIIGRGEIVVGTAALNSVNLTYTAENTMLTTTRRNGGNSGSRTWNQRHEEGLK